MAGGRCDNADRIRRSAGKTRVEKQGARKAAGPAAPLSQDPHRVSQSQANSLEGAIGRQVNDLRKKLGMTIHELARQAGLSAGMLSKIENGGTSPSLSTLQALAGALSVPVTALFAGFEEKRDVSFVRSGRGLKIERRGTRAGHQYQLLGHAPSAPVSVEPYLITLTDSSDTFPTFQHDGLEFIYMLKGRVGYRHGDKVWELRPGDSLLFDPAAPHGPEDLIRFPIQFLSVIIYPKT